MENYDDVKQFECNTSTCAPAGSISCFIEIIVGGELHRHLYHKGSNAVFLNLCTALQVGGTQLQFLHQNKSNAKNHVLIILCK